jgi:hypothetical protein
MLDPLFERLMAELPVLEELDFDRYDEIPRFEDQVENVTPDGALLLLGTAEVWFPKSQLRQLDGTLYASHWILKQKRL